MLIVSCFPILCVFRCIQNIFGLFFTFPFKVDNIERMSPYILALTLDYLHFFIHCKLTYPFISVSYIERVHEFSHLLLFHQSLGAWESENLCSKQQRKKKKKGLFCVFFPALFIREPKNILLYQSFFFTAYPLLPEPPESLA